jgi:hypothetical protein
VSRLLTPEELGELAKRIAEAKDPAEADRLQEEIERGFYGGQEHAYPEYVAPRTKRRQAGAPTSVGLGCRVSTCVTVG